MVEEEAPPGVTDCLSPLDRQVAVEDQSELVGLSDLAAPSELVVRLEAVDHLEATASLAVAADEEEAEALEALEAEQEDDQLQQEADCSEGEGAAEQSDRDDKAGQKQFPL